MKKSVLTISGSLRAASSNSLLLRALKHLEPVGLELIAYEGIGDLPHFNPDLDKESPPESVAVFREAIAKADGVLISSPEYAHGVPGSLKNALDWVVSSSGFVRKPVVLLSCSSGDSDYAQAQLGETLKIMEADIILAAALSAPLIKKSINENGRIAAPELAQALAAILTDFLSQLTGESFRL